MYHQEMVGNTLLVNPSSIIPSKESGSMIIFDTTTRLPEQVML